MIRLSGLTFIVNRQIWIFPTNPFDVKLTHLLVDLAAERLLAVFGCVARMGENLGQLALEMISPFNDLGGMNSVYTDQLVYGLAPL